MTWDISIYGEETVSQKKCPKNLLKIKNKTTHTKQKKNK
jgi:hypothetical protein